jgi:hypothetical protein
VSKRQKEVNRLNKKIFAGFMILMFFASMLVFVDFAQATITESYLYDNVVKKIKVSLCYSNGTVAENRSFRYNEYWYAKKFMYEYGTNFSSVVKPQSWPNGTGKFYIANGTEGIKGYSLVIGMEDSNEHHEGFEDLIITIDANVDNKNQYYMTFIDCIMGAGSWRKKVYHVYPNGTERLIFDYPTDKQRYAQEIGYLGCYACFEDYFFPEKTGGQGGTVYGSSEYSYQQLWDSEDVQGTASRLAALCYSGSPWQFSYNRTRFEEGNNNKWYFKVFNNDCYEVTLNASWQQQIGKYVIGFEDMSSQSQGSHDNYIDLVIEVVHIIWFQWYGGVWNVKKLEKKLDFIQCTGGMRKLVKWEATGLGQGGWTGIFGTSGYEKWKYNIALETINY